MVTHGTILHWIQLRNETQLDDRMHITLSLQCAFLLVCSKEAQALAVERGVYEE